MLVWYKLTVSQVESSHYRAAHHKHPCNNNADHDEDELPGIVSPLDVCGLGFLLYCPSPTARENSPKVKPMSKPMSHILLGVH
jgi:hypothetical protein